MPLRPLSRSSYASILRPPNPRTRLKPALSPYIRFYASKTSQPDFSYRITASFSSKKQALDLTGNTYFHNGRETYLPLSFEELTALNSAQRFKVRYKSGQDSFFVTNTAEAVAFGVVDGVGGWADHGIDPAEFAHRLCEYMSHEASAYSNEKQKTELHSAIDVPRFLLQSGFEQVMEDETVLAGGSTACIGCATSDGMLHVAK
jgi:protein phosphatase PTC7